MTTDWKVWAETHLDGTKRGTNGQLYARCPLHADQKASLSINPDEGIAYCHGGCEFGGTLAGLGQAAGFPVPGQRGKNGTSKKTYTYQDENGNPLLRVVRSPGKKFRQQRFEAGQWKWGLKNARRVPYNLPQLVAAPQDDLVLWVEGEKDCETARHLGLLATTSSGGASNFGTLDRDALKVFEGRKVVIIPDNDEPGEAYARDVAQALRGAGAQVAILRLPDLGPKEDLTNWVDRGGTKEQLLGLLERRRAKVIPLASKQAKSGKPAWPDPPDEAAYHGLAGRAVKAIEPHSEADQVAILAQLLAAIGHCIGRSPHLRVESDNHACNLFVAIVGKSGKARKGTSWGWVERLVGLATEDDPDIEMHLASGLSSGEGIIARVRDKTDDEDQSQWKRLIIVEGELAGAISSMARQGNTLSAVIRLCYDGRVLQILTRADPVKATRPHVSMIGHITVMELTRNLNAVELANGFANRWLWVLAKRSKCLPFGGSLDDDQLAELAFELRQVLQWARERGRIQWSAEAREMWIKVYPVLSRERDGLAGAVLGRLEAHAIRLAALYALLDRQDVIGPDHLRAALAVIEYAEASALYLWGNSLGDPIADKLLDALREAPEGMTRTVILREVFKCHKKAAEITAALERLQERGLVFSTPLAKGGERWFASAEEVTRG